MVEKGQVVVDPDCLPKEGTRLVQPSNMQAHELCAIYKVWLARQRKDPTGMSTFLFKTPPPDLRAEGEAQIKKRKRGKSSAAVPLRTEGLISFNDD